MNNGIAAGHHLTLEIAENILSNGGNAFDALVAAYLGMAVSEPAMTSAGAGGFLNMHSEKNGNVLIDFFCQTPKNKNKRNPNFLEIEVDFGITTEMYYAGPASMAVSGAMALVYHLVENYCTIPLKELVQPAQALATNGVEITAFQAYDLELLRDIFGSSLEGRRLFFQDDQIKKEGHQLHMPDYALFLDSLASEKSDWFYRGEVAQTVSKFCREEGGFIEYDDFIDYKLNISKPFRFPFANHTISVPGLPSMGGGLMAIFLDTLGQAKVRSGSRIHFDKLLNAFESCRPHIRNSDSLKGAVWQRFNQNLPGPIDPYTPTSGTSHLNIADTFGNAVSLSTSIGEGSSYFIPGTNMHMNNMLGETALLPNGLNSWRPNARLNSMMSPTLVFDSDGALVLATGSGGATRIPFSIGQVIYNRLVQEMNLEMAINSPRIYLGETQLYMESGYDYEGVEIPYELKLWTEKNMLFGGVHSIDIENEQSMGDDRREGAGKSF